MRHLHGGKDDAAICMLELRHDPLANVFALLFVLSYVTREGV
jgi:hypothetical protein